MRVVQFHLKDVHCLEGSLQQRVGIQLTDENGPVIDLSELSGRKLNVVDLIKMSEDGVHQFSERVKVAEEGLRIPLEDLELEAPITNPGKVVCIGMNYWDHCKEQNIQIPDEPVVFNKFSSSVVGPFVDIQYPEVSKELDWEVELAIVIGKTAKNVSPESAMNHVFGFTTANDVSARDWQMRRNGGQWLIGKAMDGLCPIGPALVTKDAIGNPHKLQIKCEVNGVVRQDSNTDQMVFKTEEIVSWLSKFFTLHPGDIILTGTPPGVGVFMKPAQFLQKGDVVKCTIEKIGSIINKFV